MTRKEALEIYRRNGLLLAQMSVREDIAERLVALEQERDASLARIAELEASARRERATTLEFIEEMEDTRKALHEEKNRTHSLKLRIAELEAAQQWRPMETAPLGKRVIVRREPLWDTPAVTIASQVETRDGWKQWATDDRWGVRGPLLAWLPLPEPPKESV